MRTDVDHLPAVKQRELERVVQILFEEFEDATKLALGDRKMARILKIILFGSFARGDWVQEPHTAKGYQSDFDLLIIVNQSDVTDRATYWYRADERLIREQTIKGAIGTPTNFIVHSLQEVNNNLAEGRFFFMDIAKEGVAIYQADDTELSRPKPKTPAASLAMAREYFDEWFPSAAGHLDTARYVQTRGRPKEAAFNLHQAAERLYHCVLLTVGFYTPHSHNLQFLRSQADKIDRRLLHVWPIDAHADRSKFTRLKEAYVKARYSKTLSDQCRGPHMARSSDRRARPDCSCNLQ